jgi:hypothetical protein
VKHLAAAASLLLGLLGEVGCQDEPRPAPQPRTTTAKPFPALPCRAGAIATYREGHILACVVGERTAIGPIGCAAGFRVALHPSGRLAECILERDHAWNGVPCQAGELIRFSEAGKLRQCSVAVPYRTSGVHCTGRLELFETQRLERCRIAAASQLGAVSLPEHATVTLDEAGKLARLEQPPKTPLSFGGFSCTALDFRPDGHAWRCSLATPTTVRGAALPAGSSLCFDAAGKPVRVEPSCAPVP